MKTLLVGLLLFVIFAVAFAPASLLRIALPQDRGIELLEPAGTLWQGAGQLYLAGQPAGRMAWELAPTRLLRGVLGYQLALSGPEQDLTGNMDVGLTAGALTVAGTASAAFANRWLGPYDIALSGTLSFDDAHVRVPYDYAQSGAGAGSGSLAWTGGPVQYRLANRAYTGNLPPLVARLGDGLETVVYPRGGSTPLLRAEVLPNGFVKIGITQLLTRLAGNPWPGSHADGDVVLEVEEQLF